MSLTPDEIKRSNAARRAMGYLPPEDEGFFGEMMDGAAYSFCRLFNMQDALRNHQNWERPGSLRIDSWCGRMLGEGWFISGPVAIVLLYFLVFRWGKRLLQRARTRRQLEKIAAGTALEELESGNINKNTWATALIRTKGDETKARAVYLKMRSKE